MTKKLLKRILNNFKKNLIYFKTISNSKKQLDKDKIVFLDITNIRLDSYVANLIIFFKICGFTVYLPKNKNLIYKLSTKVGEVKYVSSVIDEDVVFGRPNLNKNTLIFNDNQLSNNYFNKVDENKNSYYIPMSEYPLMYNDYSSRNNVNTSVLRNCSAFMSGNFTKGSYNKISSDNIFEIVNRRDVYEFVIEQDYYKKLNSIKELNIPNVEISRRKVYLVDTHSDFSIALNKLKSILIKFDFFVALPGVVMPQVHNLIEAMSVACIPIIHKTYASLLTPKLKNKENCLVYSSLKDLGVVFNNAFLLEQDKIIHMRERVLEYYKTYLSPESVVKNIIDLGSETLYIQAEQDSVELLKNSI